MTIDMSPELEEFVDESIARGQFDDRNAVIEHALRLMKLEREEAIAGIEAGLRDVEAGRTKSVEQAFAEIRAQVTLSSQK